MLFGVNQKGPEIDYLTEYLDEKELNIVDRDLVTIREVASANIKKSQEYNQKWFDEHCKPARSYNIGDFVVIRHTENTPNKKFIPHFRGPYIVHKILQNDRYVIRDIEDCQITQLPYDGVVEAKHIRLWKSAVTDSAQNETVSFESS